MLKIERTGDNNKLFISGDYEDLFFLREAVSSLTGEKTSYEGYEEVHSVVQKFVFEILHTYRAERDSFKTNCDTPCYKFEMYFPEAIFIADVLNDYIILWESDENYIFKMDDRNSSVADKMKDRHFIDKAFVRFFQASVWNAVREVIGENKFKEIEVYRNYENICNKGELRYKGYCSDWIDIMNIRYITNDHSKGDCLGDVIKNFVIKGEDYLSREKAMREHAKDGNISDYIDLLDELKYPEEIEDDDFLGISLLDI